MECDNRFRAYYRTKKAAESLPRLLFPGYKLSPALTVVGGEQRAGGVDLSIWDDAAGDLVTQRVWLPAQAAREAREVYEAWREVLSYIERNKNHHVLLHPAVTVQRVNRHVVGAYVNKCYLEKSEMRWWGTEELERAVRQRPHEFRRFFGEAVPKLLAGVHCAAAAATSTEKETDEEDPAPGSSQGDETSSEAPCGDEEGSWHCCGRAGPPGRPRYRGTLSSQ